MASPGPTVGGMENQVAWLANALAHKNDVSVCVLAAESYRYLFDASVRFNACAMQRSRRNPFLLCSLLKVIKAFKPDVVHAHGHKAAQLAASLKIVTGGVKLIATAHGLKKNNRVMARMDAVIAVSKGLQDVLSTYQAVLIFNGVPALPEAHSNLSKQELCARFGLESKIPLIIALGRLAKVKRYDRLVKAMASVNASLLLVGDGPERAHLSNIAPENVVFAGYREDARVWLGCADLMVMTSEREGFSLALIEALQAQVPVLSTRVPGAIEFLPESCLIEPAELSDLGARLRSVLDHLGGLKSDMAPTFELAKSQLTVDRMSEQTYAVYKKLIETSA